jgi:hypothetical protein
MYNNKNNNNKNINDDDRDEFVVVDTIMRFWPWRLHIRGSSQRRFSGRSEIPPRQLSNSEYWLSEKKIITNVSPWQKLYTNDKGFWEACSWCVTASSSEKAKKKIVDSSFNQPKTPEYIWRHVRIPKNTFHFNNQFLCVKIVVFIIFSHGEARRSL